MSRWFRHYAGMMRDDKLVRVAIRSGQPVERVVWVWGAILESASEIDDDGRFDLDCAEVAYFLRADEADIGSIVSGLEAAGRLLGSTVAKWGDRQFSSDRSKERQAAYRERKKTGQVRGDGNGVPHDSGNDKGDDSVTSPSRHCDAPETETETDTNSIELVPPEPQNDDEPVRPEHVIEAWNAMADTCGLPKARMTPGRRTKLKTFVKRNTVDDITEAIWRIPSSDFLCGRNGREWRADLDFLLTPSKFPKILEGSYG